MRGDGVKVRVVKEESVMPRNTSDVDDAFVVRTTTEWTVDRISRRSSVDIGGSAGGL